MSTAINVSFPAFEPQRSSTIAKFIASVCSVIGTKVSKPDTIDWNEVRSRLMEKTSRALRLVVRRIPKAYRPHEHVSDYLLCYVIEELECGHEMTVYPQADPLIAKRRLCHKCHDAASSLPPKKPSAGVAKPAAIKINLLKPSSEVA